MTRFLAEADGFFVAGDLMNLHSMRFRCLCGIVLISFAAALPGCGGSASQKVADEPAKVPTATENLHAALTSLAANGEKDSGTGLLKDEIEKLRGTPGVDADALLKDFETLSASTSKPKTAATAKAMLEKLPKS
jgi:hypothetical protein